MDRAMDNTILVVEDDPQLQEVLSLNLQNAGYRVQPERLRCVDDSRRLSQRRLLRPRQAFPARFRS